jgi:hypothetical protein
MDQSTRIQFLRLPPEAQRAACWRLTLSGQTAEQIAERTGWSVEQVRHATTQTAVVPRDTRQAARRSRWRKQ